MACLTTDLLTALGKIEPVFIPLVLAFRYWAKVSERKENYLFIFLEGNMFNLQNQAFSCSM